LVLLCGLGNKGSTYQNTRHNIGYLVLDRFADKFGIKFSRKNSGCIIGEGNDVLLAKPDTYMNISGSPLFSLLKKRNLTASDLLVIHDDLDMEFGRIKIRWNGGDGGHKGVRSIADHLRTNEFHRLKVGIGRDPISPPEEYVLSLFRREELDFLVSTLDRAADALKVFLTEGSDKAMNVFNVPK
jgi:peptidyl-tRNA hydrolase, PTH1 family